MADLIASSASTVKISNTSLVIWRSIISLKSPQKVRTGTMKLDRGQTKLFGNGSVFDSTGLVECHPVDKFGHVGAASNG